MIIPQLDFRFLNFFLNFNTCDREFPFGKRVDENYRKYNMVIKILFGPLENRSESDRNAIASYMAYNMVQNSFASRSVQAHGDSAGNL